MPNCSRYTCKNDNPWIAAVSNGTPVSVRADMGRATAIGEPTEAFLGLSGHPLVPRLSADRVAIAALLHGIQPPPVLGEERVALVDRGILNARFSQQFALLSFLYVVYNDRSAIRTGTALSARLIIEKLSWLLQL